MLLPSIIAFPGSSPHTRGAPHRWGLTRGVAGIIPAYAGSTAATGAWRPIRSDHPRIRGEHGLRRHGHRRHRGSSPHTRGAPTSCPSSHSRLPDHPRIRGEHDINLANTRNPLGSSPHTRGAPWLVGSPGWLLGIIPAYAGSTSGARCAARAPSDHPRIRGEHFLMMVYAVLYRGSSPHTRGARMPGDPRRFRFRIIPAYAGSTGEHTKPSHSRRDHPRIRGEHSTYATSIPTRGGSSPHTRGALGLAVKTGDCERIIPAYAGSTCVGPPGVAGPGDHPRIRGEHFAEAHGFGLARGSSPHTRGARDREIGNSQAVGIIPAYAGSTAGRQPTEPATRDHPRIRGEH